MNFKIEWVNHAGYILTSEGTSLLVDPWLSKSAFNNGWDLVSPTVVSEETLRSVDYIWFSHEHPDHFSVPDLLGTLKKNCLNAKIVFQKTKDNRVKNFCLKQGYKFIEVGPDQVVQLGERFSIRILPHGAIDSLSIVQVGDEVIINTNDCVLTPEECDQIKNLVPKCSVLLTQFSYASWTGNADQPHVRKNAVAEKWAEIKGQVEAFSPDYVIPFASFIFFSHEENRYMNDEVASVRRVAERIEGELQKACVVLYPGQIWDFPEHPDGAESHDNADALELYDRDFSQEKAFRTSEVVLEDALLESSKKYLAKIRKKNGRLVNYFFFHLGKMVRLALKKETVGIGGTSIYVNDIDKSFTFDIHNGLRFLANGRANVDAELGSESLNFALNNEFGFSSLQVNGRFQVASESAYVRFRRAFSLGLLNSVGETLLRNRLGMLSKNGTATSRSLYVHLHDKEPSYIMN